MDFVTRSMPSFELPPLPDERLLLDQGSCKLKKRSIGRWKPACAKRGIHSVWRASWVQFVRTSTASTLTGSDESATGSGGKTVGSGRARRFEIIFRPDTDEAPISLKSVVDANQATMMFHAQVQRLMREGTPGELVIMNHHDRQGSHEVAAVLRQPLS
jgi:hypothetical protein